MQIEIPEKLGFLFQPWRHKVAWGGRDGAKSWSFAQALLAIGIMRSTRILVGREVQKSIKQSVHQLMQDTIERLKITALYEPLDTEIRSKVNDTRIMYTGLQSHTVESIKSYEAVDILWIEEGQSVSNRSLEIVLPTIRKTGSEIWVSMNPILRTDPAWVEFVERADPSDSRVAHITYRDNKWTTDEMRKLRARARIHMDPETFANIWEGLPRGTVRGSIFGPQIRWMRDRGRIGKVPVDRRLRLNAFFDLGQSVGNATSIWMHQQSGTQHRFVKHWAEHGRGLAYWWKTMEDWRKAQGDMLGGEVKWDRIYLPHDGTAKMQGAEIFDRVQIMEGLIAESRVQCEVKALPRTPALGAAIDLTREKMSDAYIDEHECADGISALEHYRYKFDEERQAFSREPYHDWASNPADSFRQWAQWYDESPPERGGPPVVRDPGREFVGGMY